MLRLHSSAFSLLFALAAVAGAQPRQVLLIRHAEKPANDADFHLSAAGKKRADALPELFRKSDGRPDPLPKPDFIFAATNSRHSHRPVETVTPLARSLKLPVDTRFENDDEVRLAKELLTNPRYEGKTVLVCWHHGHLPELARKLGVAKVPEKWKDGVFDQVWVITFDEKGKASLAGQAQKLLAGDAPSDR
jgi:broad specificity phosphatase PhoE